MPEPTDPWWDSIRVRLEELLALLDAADRRDARLVAVHVSTALDCVEALLHSGRPPAP